MQEIPREHFPGCDYSQDIHFADAVPPAAYLLGRIARRRFEKKREGGPLPNNFRKLPHETGYDARKRMRGILEKYL